MESTVMRPEPLKETNFRKFVTQAVILWCAGFKEACSLQRVLFFYNRSIILRKRTWQCFLLNGCIFLGSIFLLKFVVTPILQWILPIHSLQRGTIASYDCQIFEEGERFYSLPRSILTVLFYVFWFYPMYVLSFIISSIRYNEIAQQACKEMEQSRQDLEIPNSGKDRVSDKRFMTNCGNDSDGLEGVMVMTAEKIYSFLMLNIFFIEVTAISYIPYIAANGTLLDGVVIIELIILKPIGPFLQGLGAHVLYQLSFQVNL